MSNTITVAILLSSPSPRARGSKSYLRSWFFNEGATYISSCTNSKGEPMVGGVAYPSFDAEQFRIPYTHLKVNSAHKGKYIETALEMDAWGGCKTLAFNDPFHGPVPFELIFDLQGVVGDAIGVPRTEDWEMIEEAVFTGHIPTPIYRIDGSVVSGGETVEASLKEDIQLFITFEVGSNLLQYGDTTLYEGAYKRLQVIPNAFVRDVRVVRKGEQGWLPQLSMVGVPVQGSFTAGSSVTTSVKPMTMEEAVVQASNKKSRAKVEGAIRGYWKKEVWDKLTDAQQRAFVVRAQWKSGGKTITKQQWVVSKLKASSDWAEFRNLDINVQKKVITRLTEWKITQAKELPAQATQALNALSQGIQAASAAAQPNIEDVFQD
jgi:hypothetical protein